MRNFWVVNDEADYGNIIADNAYQAERLLFEGILRDDYPLDAVIIEEMIDDSQIEVYENIEDDDIISIEDSIWPPSSS